MPAPERAPRLAIIVVNFGSHELVERNVPRLMGGAPGAAGPIAPAVVIVDNHHSVAEAQAIAAVCARHGWDLVQNASNTGFGSAMNSGVERAQALGCAIHLMINPDASLTPAGVATLFARVREHPLTLRSPTVVTPTGSRWFDGGVVAIDRGTTRTSPGSDSSAPTGWLSGACLMVSDELWRRVGGFDDRYFLYWEDVDLSWRCVAAGGALTVDSDVTAVHSVGGTQTTRGKSPTYVYYNCRNRLIFAGTHLSRDDRRSWSALSGRYAWAVIGRGGRRELVRRALPLAAAALRGTLDGLRVAREKGAPLAAS